MPSSLNTFHAQSVEVEITSGPILTALAIALGVDFTDVEQAIPLLKQGTKYNMMNRCVFLQPSVYQAIQPLISHPQSSDGLNGVITMCKMSYGSDVDGVHTSNNLSSPTMTNQETSSAYKPVTLTLTGQLKPNTLTKAPPKKSSRSSKSSKMTAAINPSFWGSALVSNAQW